MKNRLVIILTLLPSLVWGTAPVLCQNAYNPNPVRKSNYRDRRLIVIREMMRKMMEGIYTADSLGERLNVDTMFANAFDLGGRKNKPGPAQVLLFGTYSSRGIPIPVLGASRAAEVYLEEASDRLVLTIHNAAAPHSHHTSSIELADLVSTPRDTKFESQVTRESSGGMSFPTAKRRADRLLSLLQKQGIFLATDAIRFKTYYANVDFVEGVPQNIIRRANYSLHPFPSSLFSTYGIDRAGRQLSITYTFGVEVSLDHVNPTDVEAVIFAATSAFLRPW